MTRAVLLVGAGLLAGCADILGLDFADKRLAQPSEQVLSDPSLTGPFAFFGWSIDLDGDTLLIGAPRAAHVAERQPNGAWKLVQKLERPTGPGAGTRVQNEFANNVAVHGEWAMIADCGNGVDSSQDAGAGGSEPGEVFVFRRRGNRFEWTGQKLQAGGSRNHLDRFGWDIAIDGDTAAISATGDNERVREGGAVYVYTLQGEEWLPLEKLSLQTAAIGDRFGAAVALENDTLAVSAQYRDDPRDQDVGAIYVYTRGVRFGDAAPYELWPSGTDKSGQTLESVSISGDALLAGAERANEDRGLAFAFQRTAGSWRAPFALPTNAERATLAADAHFGRRVAVDGNLAVVTTAESGYNGAGYIYRRRGGKWNFWRRVSSERSDGFGYDVKVHGSTVAIGALLGEPGAVYVYDFPDQ